MKMFRKEEGFTLVELMVVVLIIGILVAIAIPVFNAAKGNAQRRSCQSNVRTIEGAYQTYCADDVGNVAAANTVAGADLTMTSAELAGLDSVSADAPQFVPDFVKEMPTCPAGGTYGYILTNAGNSLDMTCSATGH